MSVVLVGALFAGCIDFGGKTEEKSEADYSVKEWEWYVNEDWGYKIKYPKDWETTYVPGWELFDAVKRKKEYPKIIAIDISVIEKEKSSIFESIDADIEESIRLRKKLNGDNFKLLEKKEIRVDGLRAIKLKWALYHEELNVVAWNTEVFTRKGGDFYTIRFTFDLEPDSLPPKEIEKMGEEMIASFRWI